ncbi:Uncharacterised protein [BD1-7 clade bacterium]|uniref:HPr kinase/phosphorylase n=1 Tax=BD1-7 clade bacterium TaxID=2029982 RepID=A0A5S9QTW1_9GAMM|nr:Uncharacterised protein [BD1-7 clade bacterium]
MMYFYSVFGLSICSDIALPLQECSDKNENTDIHINQANVPDKLERVTEKATLFSVNEDEFLFCIPDIGKYLVTSGQRITYQMADNGDEKAFKTHLLGSVMGALLHQRGFIVLHASAIAFGHEALLFGGASGVGKSTIVGALHKKGYPFISDDISVLIERDGQLYIVPGYPHSRLWDDSMLSLSINSKGMDTAVKSENKFIVPIADSHQEALPVKGILQVIPSEADAYAIEKLEGGTAIKSLHAMLYRKKIRYAIQGQARIFSELTRLAKHTNTYSIQRPNNRWSLETLEACLQHAFTE